MEEFPSNSQQAGKKPKAPNSEERHVERVVKKTAIQRRPSLGSRFREVFLKDDGRNVGSYVLLDVLLPAAKDAISDAVSQGIDRMLFGDGRPASRSRSRSSAGFVNYQRMSSSSSTPPWKTDPRDRQMSRRARATHDFDEIVVETRGEAEDVLDRLNDLISQYGSATVSDLYDLTGITGNYTDNKWGWTDLQGSGIRRTREGYLLQLPKPDSLD